MSISKAHEIKNIRTIIHFAMREKVILRILIEEIVLFVEKNIRHKLIFKAEPSYKCVVRHKVYYHIRKQTATKQLSWNQGIFGIFCLKIDPED